VHFEFLHPPVPQAGVKALTGNDASCVLRIATGSRAILLTGDIATGIESRLVEQYGTGLAADVLVAGHHGSSTSTGAALLDAVNPRLVLFAAGYANPFGFPSTVVAERLAARAVPTLNTAVTGAIELRFGADGAISGPWTWRERSGRIWTHRANQSPAD
jgi:competence protein ComEC